MAARAGAAKLAKAKGPTAFILPTQGIEGWDRPGEPLHDAPALAAFCDELRKSIKPPVRFVELDAHINDAVFTDTVLRIFDEWVAEGRIAPGRAVAA